MAKFSGMIGFQSATNHDGKWVEEYTEKSYKGDIVENVRRLQGSESINDNISLSNQFSIVADQYATLNYQNIRYIVYNGTKWKVESVSVNYPRMTLSCGGIYNA